MPYINRDQLSTQDLILEVENVLTMVDANLITLKVRSMQQRYPDAVYGRSYDYRFCEPLTAPYAIITLPDGYAVHRTILPAGVVGALIERIRL